MIYYDIETAPLPIEQLKAQMPEFKAPANWKDEAKIAAKLAEQEAAYIEKAALSPITGQVVAIGIYDGEVDRYQAMEAGCTEKERLEWFWEAGTDRGAMTRSIAGWNSNGFDLPFLIKRSWAAGVKIPSTLIEIYRGRAYLNPRCVDLMEVFCAGNAETRCSLNNAAQLIGLGQKTDLSGRLYYQIVEEFPDLASEYLQQDVQLTAQIGERIMP